MRLSHVFIVAVYALVICAAPSGAAVEDGSETHYWRPGAPQIVPKGPDDSRGG